MIGENSMKHHYLKKKDFYSHINMANITDADYVYAEFAKGLKQIVQDNIMTCMTCIVKLDLLNDIDILLIVERDIKGGISHSIYRYVKADNKCMNKL